MENQNLDFATLLRMEAEKELAARSNPNNTTPAGVSDEVKKYLEAQQQSDTITEMGNAAARMIAGESAGQVGRNVANEMLAKNLLQRENEAKKNRSGAIRDYLQSRGLDIGEANLAQRKKEFDIREPRLQEMAELQIDKTNRPSDKEVAEVAGYADTLTRIADIRKMKKNFDTGPLAGRAHSLSAMVGTEDPEYARFASAVGSNLVDYIRQTSGLTVTDAERAYLEKIIPTINTQDESFNSKLDEVEKWVQKKMSVRQAALNKQGKYGDRLLNPQDLEYLPGSNNQPKQQEATTREAKPANEMTEEEARAEARRLREKLGLGGSK